MDLASLIGIVASMFTAVATLPQLIKICKEKKAENISVGMFAVLVIGLGFWIYYGCLKKDWIIIIANSVSFIINLSTALLSLKYKMKLRHI